MSQNQILLIFCVACFAGYFIAYIKKRPSALLFVIGRSTAGLGFIYFFNFFCAARDIVTGVGINPITGTVCTLLEFPAQFFYMLYGSIASCKPIAVSHSMLQK